MNQNSTEEKSDCENSLVLPSLDTLSSIRGGLFMMETSGRDRLTARQACAVESAAAQSDLQVFLYIHYSGPFRAGSHLSLCHKEPAKPTVGAFGCLELVLYAMRELAEHHHENIPIWDISPRFM